MTKEQLVEFMTWLEQVFPQIEFAGIDAKVRVATGYLERQQR